MVPHLINVLFGDSYELEEYQEKCIITYKVLVNSLTQKY